MNIVSVSEMAVEYFSVEYIIGLDMLEHQIVFFGIHPLVIQDNWREEEDDSLVCANEIPCICTVWEGSYHEG